MFAVHVLMTKVFWAKNLKDRDILFEDKLTYKMYMAMKMIYFSYFKLYENAIISSQPYLK